MAEERVPTGVSGLDEILHGGLVAQRTILVRGEPGTGKTMLGLHFLAEGARRGESSLFINHGIHERTIRESAASIGLDISGVHFLDLTPTPDLFSSGEGYDIFRASDVERQPITDRVMQMVETL